MKRTVEGGRRALGVLLCMVALQTFAAEAPRDPPRKPPHEPPASLEVMTDRGAVVGARTAHAGLAWRGIPYAAAPVGPLRWRAATPAASWSGVRPALRAGAPCAQPFVDHQGGVKLVGSEDCLYLNVYAPPPTKGRTRLPVMFFIHGGGQMYGAGSTYDGAVLAERENVIVVTINYRLGLFGWFHHPAITSEGGGTQSGQFALTDLIEGLRWVRGNIAAFGGNPDNVTIFGESAGAQNVYALVLAPAAAGLFHKAIAESGGLWNMTLTQAVNYQDDPVPGTPLSAREVVASLLVRSGRARDLREARIAASREPPGALAAWLRTLPATTIAGVYATEANAGYDLPSVVYDGVLLPEGDYAQQLKRGDYNKVPMIVGGNRDEQKLYLSADASLRTVVDGRTVIRDPVHYAAVNRYYSQWWNFMAVDDFAGRLSTPVYAYRFDWDDEPTAPYDIRSLFGAAHGLELAFVFGHFDYGFIHDDVPGADNAAPADDPYRALFNPANVASRVRISKAMMSYWAEFAANGSPGTGSRHDLPVWPSFAASKSRLVFGNGMIDLQPGTIDGKALLKELRESPVLSPAEKCAILLDNTMYPNYAAGAAERPGCPR